MMVVESLDNCAFFIQEQIVGERLRQKARRADSVAGRPTPVVTVTEHVKHVTVFNATPQMPLALDSQLP